MLQLPVGDDAAKECGTVCASVTVDLGPLYRRPEPRSRAAGLVETKTGLSEISAAQDHNRKSSRSKSLFSSFTRKRCDCERPTISVLTS